MAERYLPPVQSQGPGPEETKVLKFLDSIEDESNTVEKQVKSQWESNLGWYRGQQWTMRNRAPLFTANKIGQIIRKKQAKLTEMKPQCQIKARRAGMMTTETVLQETMEAGWDEYNMQMILEDLAGHLLIYGAGFLSITWDPHADFGQGDIVPACLDPRYVHIDPAVQRAQDLDEAAYVWTSAYVPAWSVEKKFPGRGSMVQLISGSESESGSGVQRYLNKVFAAWKSGNTPVPEAVPRVELRDYYFLDPAIGQDGRPLYPAGRHVVRGGSNMILKDEPNVYFDERWPIIMVDGIPDPEHPWGQSEVQALKKIQDAVNRIGHMFVENTILTGNTWITADQQALTPTTMQRLSNIGAVIIEKAMGRSVERETPPPMPPHMMGFIDIALALMDQLAGLSDTTAAAQGRVEVRSEEQLEGLQQATEVLIRATARRIESGLERLGHRWISRIFQFYTRNRVLTQLGPTLEWETFEFERRKLLKEIEDAAQREAIEKMGREEALRNINQIYKDATHRAWRNFLYKVTPGSSLASVRANRAALHMSLVSRGLLSGTHVLRDFGFPNPEEEIDKARQETMLMGGLNRGGGDDAAPPVRQAI